MISFIDTYFLETIQNILSSSGSERECWEIVDSIRVINASNYFDFVNDIDLICTLKKKYPYAIDFIIRGDLVPNLNFNLQFAERIKKSEFMKTVCNDFISNGITCPKVDFSKINTKSITNDFIEQYTFYLLFPKQFINHFKHRLNEINLDLRIQFILAIAKYNTTTDMYKYAKEIVNTIQKDLSLRQFNSFITHIIALFIENSKNPMNYNYEKHSIPTITKIMTNEIINTISFSNVENYLGYTRNNYAPTVSTDYVNMLFSIITDKYSVNKLIFIACYETYFRSIDLNCLMVLSTEDNKYDDLFLTYQPNYVIRALPKKSSNNSLMEFRRKSIDNLFKSDEVNSQAFLSLNSNLFSKEEIYYIGKNEIERLVLILNNTDYKEGRNLGKYNNINLAALPIYKFLKTYSIYDLLTKGDKENLQLSKNKMAHHALLQVEKDFLEKYKEFDSLLEDTQRKIEFPELCNIVRVLLNKVTNSINIPLNYLLNVNPTREGSLIRFYTLPYTTEKIFLYDPIAYSDNIIMGNLIKYMKDTHTLDKIIEDFITTKKVASTLVLLFINQRTYFIRFNMEKEILNLNHFLIKAVKKTNKKTYIQVWDGDKQMSSILNIYSNSR